MKNYSLFFLVIASIIPSYFANAQAISNVERNTPELIRLSERFEAKYQQMHQRALDNAPKFNVTEFFRSNESGDVAIIGIDENGRPVVYATDNSDAAETVSTDQVWGGTAYDLTGTGVTIGEWDGGGVRLSHQEYAGRANQIDSPSSLSDHATHVAGTMIASGMNASAQGMASAATIDAYSFFNDEAEMTSFAANGGILSNHSYGTVTGWRFDSPDWYWYGDTTISGTEDWSFGFYTNAAREWDLIANNAPNYLIVKSAGNDRGDGPSGATNHFVWDNFSGWVASNTARPQDGGALGYDCVPAKGVAKNILTVGAVNDVSGGYSVPSDVVMSSFSSWGPTDDGRIKPDIVANGISLFSTSSAGDMSYNNKSGTSMSAPNATGSMALLQELHNTVEGNFMDASTLKALVIHTADEAGSNPGPDYVFGWGLLNTQSAADVILNPFTNTIVNGDMVQGDVDLIDIDLAPGTPFKATIVWNDPAGFTPPASLNPATLILRNDLDIRLKDPSGNTVGLPWILDPNNPASAATTGDNFRDNVEQIFLPNPSLAGTYQLEVTHKGTLASASQDYSIIISGITIPTATDFTASSTNICQGDAVTFTPTSTAPILTQFWGFPGGTPNTSTSPNPTITYNAPGDYDVLLIATTSSGIDTIFKPVFISVDPLSVVQFPDSSGICEGTLPFMMNTGTPSGGTYSGPGVSGGMFDPSAAGTGSHIIIYTVNSGACSASDTAIYQVDPSPIVNLPPFSDVCETDSAFTLSGGTPVGGMYSGPGVSMGVFDPTLAGVGTHQIVYTIAGPCPGADTSTITVVANPVVTLAPLGQVCISSSPFMLSGGTPSGGTYSGPGVTGNMFDPSAAGLGNHIITYEFINSTGCAGSDQSTITVTNFTAVSFPDSSGICENSASFVLTAGVPTGGVYSGSGVIAGNSFDPTLAGVGLHQIIYSVVQGACSGSDTAFYEVVSAPVVVWSGTTNVCIDQGPITLAGALPLGGVYSGSGVTGNTFDPDIVGVGIHPIVYSYVDSNGCGDSDTAFYNVTAPPVVSISDIGGICEGSSSFMLTNGTPSGGSYSGMAVVSGTSMFDPSLATVGSNVVVYTYSDGVCTAMDTGNVEVVPLPVVALDTFPDVCVGAGTLALSGGQPGGGVYSGPGVSGNSFDPSITGPGVFTLTYTYTDSLGCSASVSESINVVEDSVSIQNNPSEYCLTDTAVVLVGTPIGGQFIGQGVSNGVFDATVAGVGNHVLIYVTSGLCPGSDTLDIVVNEEPIVGNIQGPQVANTGQVFSYNVDSIQNGAQYLWTVTGGNIIVDNNSQISVQWGTGTTGIVTLTIVDGNGCTASTSIQVQLQAVGMFEIAGDVWLVYPNPIEEVIFLEVEANIHRPVEISILDLTGKVVQFQKHQLVRGANSVMLSALDLSPGIYFIRVMEGDQMLFTEKLIKR
jgi:hypothetical protein